jgi:hypothetical protein
MFTSYIYNFFEFQQRVEKSRSAYLMGTPHTAAGHFVLKAGEAVWYDPVLMDTTVPTNDSRITETGKV